MFNKIFFGLFGVFLLSHLAISFDDEGYKLYKIVLKNADQNEVLDFLESGSVYCWVLKKFQGKPSIALVGPEFQGVFEAVLTARGITFSAIHLDVSETIKNKRIENNARPMAARGKNF